jgi:hypothetical protein
MYDSEYSCFMSLLLHDVTCVFFLAETVKVGWAQRKKNRVDWHREHLLAATQQELEIELSSFAACGVSPVTSDAEQDSPASLVCQDTPDSPVVHDAPDSPVVHDACGHGHKRQRQVTVQGYPWTFVSPQLLDRKGQEIFYPVDDDRDRGGRVRWSGRLIIIATWWSATWTIYKPNLRMLWGRCSRRLRWRNVVSVVREMSTKITAMSTTITEAVSHECIRVKSSFCVCSDVCACLRRFAQCLRSVCACLRMYAYVDACLRKVCAIFAQCLRSVCAVFAQCLSVVCAEFAQRLCSVCAAFVQRLHMFAQCLHSVCANTSIFTQSLRSYYV